MEIGLLFSLTSGHSVCDPRRTQVGHRVGPKMNFPRLRFGSHCCRIKRTLKCRIFCAARKVSTQQHIMQSHSNFAPFPSFYLKKDTKKSSSKLGRTFFRAGNHIRSLPKYKSNAYKTNMAIPGKLFKYFLCESSVSGQNSLRSLIIMPLALYRPLEQFVIYNRRAFTSIREVFQIFPL